jgi:hypothetical protein
LSQSLEDGRTIPNFPHNIQIGQPIQSITNTGPYHGVVIGQQNT